MHVNLNQFITLGDCYQAKTRELDNRTSASVFSASSHSDRVCPAHNFNASILSIIYVVNHFFMIISVSSDFSEFTTVSILKHKPVKGQH